MKPADRLKKITEAMAAYRAGGALPSWIKSFKGLTREERRKVLRNELPEMPRMVPAQRPADVSEPDIDRLRENLRRAQEDAARRNDDD